MLVGGVGADLAPSGYYAAVVMATICSTLAFVGLIVARVALVSLAAPHKDTAHRLGPRRPNFPPRG